MSRSRCRSPDGPPHADPPARPAMDLMNRYATTLTLVAAAALVLVAAADPSGAASARPTVQSVSSHSGVYWGGGRITVHGQNFTGVRGVKFGTSAGEGVQVVSATTLTVVVPWHDYATVDVQV